MNAYLTNDQLRALPMGTRVVFPHGAESYPDFDFWHERLEGEISHIEAEGICVRLDVHKPELDEWDNQIQIWFWDDAPAHDVTGE